MLGLVVPAGTHAVTLRYVPPGWPWTFLGYGLGLLLALGVAGRAVRR